MGRAVGSGLHPGRPPCTPPPRRTLTLIVGTGWNLTISYTRYCVQHHLRAPAATVGRRPTSNSAQTPLPAHPAKRACAPDCRHPHAAAITRGVALFCGLCLILHTLRRTLLARQPANYQSPPAHYRRAHSRCTRAPPATGGPLGRRIPPRGAGIFTPLHSCLGLHFSPFSGVATRTTGYSETPRIIFNSWLASLASAYHYKSTASPPKIPSCPYSS